MKNKFEDFSAEVEFFSHLERKLKIKKIAKIYIPAAVVVVLLGFVFWKFYTVKKNQNQQAAEVSKVEIPKGEDHIFINDAQGVAADASLKKNEGSGKDNTGSLYASEHYRIKDMAFGGNAILLSNSSESLPLKVEDVRSEVLASKDGADVKLLITWKTNKLSKAEVAYEKGAMKRKLNENSYGLSHALVLSDLERDSRYTFSVKVRDKWGNEVLSEKHSLYTEKKPVSVFSLISEQMDQIFGWAIKR